MTWTDHKGNKFNTQKEMCEHWGVAPSTFRDRIKKGVSVGFALTCCTDHRGNSFRTKKEMCDYWGVNYSTFRSRIYRGATLKNALTLPVN